MTAGIPLNPVQKSCSGVCDSSRDEKSCQRLTLCKTDTSSDDELSLKSWSGQTKRQTLVCEWIHDQATSRLRFLMSLALFIVASAGIYIAFARGGALEIPAFPLISRDLLRFIGGKTILPNNAVPTDIQPWDNMRLPTHTIPYEYDLHLGVDMQEFRFNGTVAIHVKVVRPTHEIVLHANMLEISEASLLKGNEVRKLSWTNGSYQTVHFSAEGNMIEAGQMTLRIGFSGAITDLLRGFYRSKYRVCDDVAQFNDPSCWEHMALTHFEPLDARSAFPCFDEPAMKARFVVKLTVPVAYQAAANMPAVKEELSIDQKQKTVTFDKTPPMSTYLVAYMVSKLDHIELETNRNVTVRVWARPSVMDTATYALQAAKRILEFLESYYVIEFPLPKLDLVAVPDFAMGAMENWGLITFRDTALLYDPKYTSASAKQFVATVIAHELAHQWFGNLVSMSYWNDLWLNEGFATFVEYYGVDDLDSRYEVFDQFYWITMYKALKFDSSNFTHPISVDIQKPHDIELIFDGVSYEKGASIIRMLQTWLDNLSLQQGNVIEGTNSTYFQRGLQSYLKSHAYSNAVTNDLWISLEEEGVAQGWLVKGQLPAMMNTWTSQEGYPLVSITPSDDGTTYVLEQSRFYCCGTPSSAQIQKWTIPLSFGAAGIQANNRHQTIMNDTNGVIKYQRQTNDCENVFFMNYGHVGFYRVHYPPVLQATLMECFIASSSLFLDPQSRAGFVDDTFQLVFAGKYNVLSALNLIEVVFKQHDFTTTAVTLDFMETVLSYTELEPYSPELRKRFLKFIQDRLSSISWEVDDQSTHTDKLLAGQLVSLGLELSDPKTIATALDLFKGVKAGNQTNIDPTLISSVYNAAVKYGGLEVYSWIQKRYETSQLAAEQRLTLFALSSVQDPSLIERTLEYADSQHVRNQDAASLVRLLSSKSVLGEVLVSSFLREHWHSFMSRYAEGNSQFNALLETLVARSITEEQVNQLSDWLLKSYPFGSVSVQRGRELFYRKHKWLELNRADLQKWASQ